jgi:hypothetical protein
MDMPRFEVGYERAGCGGTLLVVRWTRDTPVELVETVQERLDCLRRLPADDKALMAARSLVLHEIRQAIAQGMLREEFGEWVWEALH